MVGNTQDLGSFGSIELEEAGILLTEYAKDRNVIPGDEVRVEFNPNSGNVFLVDEEFNVAMMNEDTLEKWYNCPYCGHEGFLEDMEHKPEDDDCTEYMEEIGVIKDETED